LDNSNDSEEDCAVDDDSDIEHYRFIEDMECPAQNNESAAPNVSTLVCPPWKSKRQAEQVLVTGTAVEMLRN
jgi:hypothetical protein